MQTQTASSWVPVPIPTNLSRCLAAGPAIMSVAHLYIEYPSEQKSISFDDLVNMPTYKESIMEIIYSFRETVSQEFRRSWNAQAFLNTYMSPIWHLHMPEDLRDLPKSVLTLQIWSKVSRHVEGKQCEKQVSRRPRWWKIDQPNLWLQIFNSRYHCSIVDWVFGLP